MSAGISPSGLMDWQAPGLFFISAFDRMGIPQNERIGLAPEGSSAPLHDLFPSVPKSEGYVDTSHAAACAAAFAVPCRSQFKGCKMVFTV